MQLNENGREEASNALLFNQKAFLYVTFRNAQQLDMIQGQSKCFIIDLENGRYFD